MEHPSPHVCQTCAGSCRGVRRQIWCSTGRSATSWCKMELFLDTKFLRKGIELDRAKVDGMLQLPVPKTVKDIMSFLVDFEFDEECHKSWTLLKDALVSAPIVQAPNWDHPFEIMCDVSDYAVGAVLGQKIDKKLNVIYYASRTWMMLNASTSLLRKIQNPASQMDSLLQEFVVDKKGVENGVADHLSRMRVEDIVPINDSMPEEQLMAIMVLKEGFDEKVRLEEVKALRDENLPWYADIVNFMVAGEVP
ncbi:unnamed protein product [Microthlaspi erraticum]|uniref:Reverse transcriptase/retrotransposon-derived protein RNase H-like domain-containing protein n=1 Tax=Microthlaspi erraticum TaxID=1685480 RepID=A0A6D2I8I0_9BRAS|nr:unnamed protein product [Microthlaspi erraticum]